MNKNLNIETLRGIAIFLVIIAHSWFVLEIKDIRQSLNFSSGVDLFFVISGFLMGVTYISKIDKHNFEISKAYNFYVKRISRLLPAVIFWNLVILCLSHFWITLKLFPNHLEIIQSVSSNILFLGNFYNYLNPNALGYWWSIALEVQFYFALPILLFLLGKNFWKGILIITLALTLTAIFNIKHSWMFRMHSLFIGLLAYKVYSTLAFQEITKKLNKLNFWHIQSLVIILILLTITVTFRLKPFFSLMPFVIGLIYAMILLLVVNLETQLFGKIIGRFFIFLGKIAFSLYLSHILVFHIGLYYIKIFNPEYQNPLSFILYPLL